jgi:hypothetical protein
MTTEVAEVKDYSNLPSIEQLLDKNGFGVKFG